MKEKMRDKSRDELANILNLVGVKAKMAERGRVEEKIEDSWYQRPLGIIDIPEGPIRWINRPISWTPDRITCSDSTSYTIQAFLLDSKFPFLASR